MPSCKARAVARHRDVSATIGEAADNGVEAGRGLKNGEALATGGSRLRTRRAGDVHATCCEPTARPGNFLPAYRVFSAPAVGDEAASWTDVGQRSAGPYQASTRGPIKAPSAAGINMPSKYQKPTKTGLTSGQCRQYTAAAAAPAAKPAVAPARRRRVGA